MRLNNDIDDDKATEFRRKMTRSTIFAILSILLDLPDGEQTEGWKDSC